MRITLTSVMVNDQQKALEFYTDILGFKKKMDIPVGDYRWITVVAADDPDGTQLALEPNAHEASRVFQAAIYADGIPYTAFQVDDIQAEVERLSALGVAFRGEPTDAGEVIMVSLDDTVGNYIQLYQEK